MNPMLFAMPRWRHYARTAAKSVLPWLSVILLAGLVIVPAAWLGWLLFGTRTFAVQAVTVIDARQHTEASVKGLVEDSLKQVPLNRNIFFVDTSGLENSIVSRLPQVLTARMERELPGTLVATIQEKTPAALLSSGGDYFFVDAQGVPYEEARIETLPGVVLPLVKNDDRAASVTIGAGAVDPSFIAFIQQVQQKLPEMVPARVAEIHIPSLGTREVYFYLDNNWQIKMDATRTGEEQLKILQRIINEVITPEEKKTLEYIDLRIPERVYYKTKSIATEKNKGKS